MSQAINFQDVIFFSQKHQIEVMDHQQQLLGTIVKTYDRKMKTEVSMPKGTFYAFLNPHDVPEMAVVVKRQVLGYTYELYDLRSGEMYALKDKPGVIYLYFHLYGTVAGKRFEAHEDWDGNCVLKMDGKKYAIVDFNELTLKVTIAIIDEVQPLLMDVAFLTQIYCLFRLYSMESKVIEEAIDWLT